MSILLGYDSATLVELVDIDSANKRLEELGGLRSLPAISEKAWLLKITNRLDESLDFAQQAVRLARFTGVRRDQIQPKILRATVLHALGNSNEALHELTLCVNDAHTQRWPRLEATALHQRGKVQLALREYVAALDDFTSAHALRLAAQVDASQLETCQLGIASAESFLQTGQPPSVLSSPPHVRIHDESPVDDPDDEHPNVSRYLKPTSAVSHVSHDSNSMLPLFDEVFIPDVEPQRRTRRERSRDSLWSRFGPPTSEAE